MNAQMCSKMKHYWPSNGTVEYLVLMPCFISKCKWILNYIESKNELFVFCCMTLTTGIVSRN